MFLIEPYYGGSHRQFMDGLRTHLVAEFHLFTLPASKWKWRVRSAPILAAEWAGALAAGGVGPDVLLASSMLNERSGLTRWFLPRVMAKMSIAF